MEIFRQNNRSWENRPLPDECHVPSFYNSPPSYHTIAMQQSSYFNHQASNSGAMAVEPSSTVAENRADQNIDNIVPQFIDFLGVGAK